MVDTAKIAEQLKARLAELTDRSEDIEEELQSPLDADWEEQAVDLADDDALAGVDEVMRDEIAQIERALDRIESGDYGECANCGKDIAEKRLEVQPTATLCIDCATAAEAARN